MLCGPNGEGLGDTPLSVLWGRTGSHRQWVTCLSMEAPEVKEGAVASKALPTDGPEIELLVSEGCVGIRSFAPEVQNRNVDQQVVFLRVRLAL